jgi:heme/copper-type cytochrome/quinol oxidase subunit 1
MAPAEAALDQGKHMYNMFVTGQALMSLHGHAAMIGGFGNWFVPLMIGLT